MKQFLIFLHSSNPSTNHVAFFIPKPLITHGISLTFLMNFIASYPLEVPLLPLFTLQVCTVLTAKKFIRFLDGGQGFG